MHSNLIRYTIGSPAYHREVAKSSQSMNHLYMLSDTTAWMYHSFFSDMLFRPSYFNITLLNFDQPPAYNLNVSMIIYQEAYWPSKAMIKSDNESKSVFSEDMRHHDTEILIAIVHQLLDIILQNNLF